MAPPNIHIPNQFFCEINRNNRTSFAFQSPLSGSSSVESRKFLNYLFSTALTLQQIPGWLRSTLRARAGESEVSSSCLKIISEVLQIFSEVIFFFLSMSSVEDNFLNTTHVGLPSRGSAPCSSAAPSPHSPSLYLLLNLFPSITALQPCKLSQHTRMMAVGL